MVPQNRPLTKESLIEKTYSSTIKPFALSLSKHERLDHTPIDGLRVNGVLFCLNKRKKNFHLKCLFNCGLISNASMSVKDSFQIPSQSAGSCSDGMGMMKTGFLERCKTPLETLPRKACFRNPFPWDPRTIVSHPSSSATFRISSTG